MSGAKNGTKEGQENLASAMEAYEGSQRGAYDTFPDRGAKTFRRKDRACVMYKGDEETGIIIQEMFRDNWGWYHKMRSAEEGGDEESDADCYGGDWIPQDELYRPPTTNTYA